MTVEKQQSVMFLGRYRSGLTSENVELYARVVGVLYRNGKQGEGALANRVQKNLGSDEWNECVERLAAWGVVEFEPARHGRARVVSLTVSGKGEFEFCSPDNIYQCAQRTAD